MTTNEIIRCSRIVGKYCIRRYIAVFYSCEFKSLYIQLSELGSYRSLGLMYRESDSNILFCILR
ncbi:hypothetical protein Cassandra_0423 [Pseudomonas phage Cassandra]|nr:hypothetical protein Cassandra_0423 [Pseudomonas phage Cassandra]